MSKRKIVNVKIGTESFYDMLDRMTPAEVIERMKELQAGYPDRHVYFNLSPYGYDGGLDLELWECREETDKEYEKRIAEEKKERDRKRAAAKAKKDKEYAEYERLKKKFGDISYLDK
jgi:NurA-like 5'-3' nuclease